MSRDLWKSDTAVTCATIVLIALSWYANNPSFDELAGRWRVASVSNLPHFISNRAVEGLNFEIDRRGLMHDPAGSSFSLLVIDIGCGPNCYGLVDNYNPMIKRGHIYRLEGTVASGRMTVVPLPNTAFTIERVSR
ncbi:MAG: hypothetical protein ABL904_01975 [Hyphomicrobiaceae bacterium]